jgi:uncharacterized protein (TIGR00369 family)
VTVDERIGPDGVGEHVHADGHGEHIGLPWYVLADYQCFGCSPHNPAGVQLQFTHHGDGLRTVFRLGRAHESYPGVVHGGLLGVIVDEIMGNLIVLQTGEIPFTTGMRLRYVLPVVVGGQYECTARVRDTGSQLIHTESEIRDEHGALVLTATASYQTVSLDTANARMSLDPVEVEQLREALAVTNSPASTDAPHITVPATRPKPSEDSHVRVD